MLVQQKQAPNETVNPKGGSRPSAADHIRRQIEQLQKELERVKESKDSPETKNGRIKDLNGQIEQLQQNLQQAALDENQQVKEEAAAKAADKAQQESAKYKDEKQLQEVRQAVNLFAVSSKFSEMKTLHRVKVDMIAKKNFAGAANITGRIMQKSLEVQEVLKRGSEIKPEQLRQKQEQDSGGNDTEVQQEQVRERDPVSGSKSDIRNKDEPNQVSSIDIKV
ncbi:MAG: hypothetical protein K0Q90_1801 [Paenibacillaceae bacterium]|jgi:hypothetical protein|nr:hypothetical protein [Paenibacillaceae bacterium]